MEDILLATTLIINLIITTFYLPTSLITSTTYKYKTFSKILFYSYLRVMNNFSSDLILLRKLVSFLVIFYLVCSQMLTRAFECTQRIF